MKEPFNDEPYKAIASMSPDECEDMLKFVQMFMAKGNAGKGQGPKATKKKTSGHYTETDYPHFRKDEPARKYTLRVTLKHITPAIYRKFEVPSNITLRHLADLILELMGWIGGHLNAFHIAGSDYSPAYQRDGEDNFFLPFDEDRNHNQEDFTLAEVLSTKGKSIELEYDFGDGWLHDVKLSSIADYKEGEPQIVRFIKGERACPLEDIGGPWGYQDLLAIIEKKRARKRLNAEEKERLEWIGIDPQYIDPEEFDGEEAEGICYSFTDYPEDDYGVKITKI